MKNAELADEAKISPSRFSLSRLLNLRKGYLSDLLIEKFFFLNGIFAVLVLFGIFSILFVNGIKAFEDISLKEFFFSSYWNPNGFDGEYFGILSMVVSTFMTTIGAMIIAIPLGIGCAVYLAEIAPQKIRDIGKPIVEILAGIPSVVIGFLGIVLVGPFIAKIFHINSGLNALNGSILLAVMALPTIISLSEDAITAVPHDYKEASLALGANHWTTITRVIIPSSFSGIIASIMLGMGRAIGETMTVLMACGNAPAMPHSFLDSVRTITASIAIELGEVPYDTTHYYALFAIGVVLFLISFLVNLIADFVLHKYQEVER